MYDQDKFNFTRETWMWQLCSKKPYRPGGSCVFESKSLWYFSLVLTWELCKPKLWGLISVLAWFHFNVVTNIWIRIECELEMCRINIFNACCSWFLFEEVGRFWGRGMANRKKQWGKRTGARWWMVLHFYYIKRMVVIVTTVLALSSKLVWKSVSTKPYFNYTVPHFVTVSVTKWSVTPLPNFSVWW